MSTASSTTMINVFEVPDAAVEQFLREWPEDLAFMQVQPGFMSGMLYKSREAGARFAFINVSHWRSEADFVAARDGLAAHWRERGTERRPSWAEAGIRMNASTYEVARTF